MKIAIIKWKDSALHGTTTLSGKDKLLTPMDGFSCGLLVKQDRLGITIATDYWGNDEWRNCETIYKKQTILNFKKSVFLFKNLTILSSRKRSRESAEYPFYSNNEIHC
jgi:hypothetical protein